MSLITKLLPFAKVALSATPLAPLVGIVSALMPGDTGLHPGVTGQQVMDAYNRLPPDRQAQADAHALAMEQEHTTQWGAMLEADATSNTMRPQVVWLYARVTALTVLAFMAFMFYVVWGLKGEGLADALRELSNMWALFAGVLGVLSTPILKYFNDRSKDKAARYAAASGSAAPLTSLLGMVKNLMK